MFLQMQNIFFIKQNCFTLTCRSWSETFVTRNC